MRAQESCYRNHPDAVLVDAQSRVEYMGGHRIYVVEQPHALPVGEADSDKEHGRSTLPQRYDGDIVKVRSLAGPSEPIV